MATTPSTIDFLLDQLQPLREIRVRKMFGEYALYCEEKIVALVCDNQLFVKITPPGKALVGERYEEGQAYPGAKPAMLISADDLEDHERLCEIIRATAAALPPPKPKKSKPSTKSKPPAKSKASATKPRPSATKAKSSARPKPPARSKTSTKPKSK